MASTDGSCRWLDDVLRPVGHPAAAAAAGAAVAERARRAAAGDRRALCTCPHGIPVLVGSADTPAASYALGTQPGGRPLLIMGTTHVVSNALDAPDHRASALQRVDVRAGRWLINGVINGGDALAVRCATSRLRPGRRGGRQLWSAWHSAPNPSRWHGAPVFIPAHPSRTRAALVRRAAHRAARRHPGHRGAVGRPRRRRRGAVRRPDDHRIVHRRTTTNPLCQWRVRRRTRDCRNCWPTYWTATSWSSTKATCPRSAPPRCAAKSSTGRPSRRRRPAVCSPAHSGGTPSPSAGSSTARYGPASPASLR